MLRVRFPPSHPDTVQKKIETALWSAKNKTKILGQLPVKRRPNTYGCCSLQTFCTTFTLTRQVSFYKWATLLLKKTRAIFSLVTSVPWRWERTVRYTYVHNSILYPPIQAALWIRKDCFLHPGQALTLISDPACFQKTQDAQLYLYLGRCIPNRQRGYTISVQRCHISSSGRHMPSANRHLLGLTEW